MNRDNRDLLLNVSRLFDGGDTAVYDEFRTMESILTVRFYISQQRMMEFTREDSQDLNRFVKGQWRTIPRQLLRSGFAMRETVTITVSEYRELLEMKRMVESGEVKSHERKLKPARIIRKFDFDE